jgi:hypothetical protein
MVQVFGVEDLSLPIFPINVALGSAPTFLQVTATFGIQPATPFLLGIFPLGAALSALLVAGDLTSWRAGTTGSQYASGVPGRTTQPPRHIKAIKRLELNER